MHWEVSFIDKEGKKRREMGAITLMLILGFVGMRECKVGREERVEVVVASYSGEMEQLLRQAVREGKQRRAVSLLLGEVGDTYLF